MADAFAEAKKFSRRLSIQLLLAMAVLLVPLFHMSMQSEVRYQRDLNNEGLRVVQAALARGDISTDEFENRVAQIRAEEVRLASDERNLRFPGALQTGLQTFATAGALFIVLAAALAFGSESGWGTYLNLVALRPRKRVFRAQLLGFVFLLGVVLIICMVVAATLGVAYRGAAVVGGAQWRGVLSALGAAVLSAVVWSLVGQFAALVARSPGVAVAVASLFWGALLFVPSFAPVIRPWTVEANVAGLSLPESSRLIHGLFIPAGVDLAVLPTPIRAVVQLTLLTALLTAINRARFRRMDLP